MKELWLRTILMNLTYIKEEQSELVIYWWQYKTQFLHPELPSTIENYLINIVQIIS